MFSLIAQRIFVAKINDRGRKNLGSEYWRRIQVRNTVSKTERHLVLMMMAILRMMAMLLRMMTSMMRLRMDLT